MNTEKTSRRNMLTLPIMAHALKLKSYAEPLIDAFSRSD